MMPRTPFAAALAAAAFLLATSVPYELSVTANGVAIAQATALAKNGNSGGGNGNGGNGGGNGGNSGNSGNSGGNGNSGSSGSGSGGNNAKASRSSEEPTDEGAGRRGGITEVIESGRYIMKDGRGRTIINRRATTADKRRLQSFAH
ncbi:hypothetical protein [Ensifer sp.]|uniref:hypothetical protein n=1 Tax=Ensifer sp. TaxID=1872086 RepID=UPI0039C85EA4